MMLFGLKRRYVLAGPLLDELTDQRLFERLPEKAKRKIVSAGLSACDASDVEPVPLFLHIPKCAGVAIGRLFRNKVGLTSWYKTIDRPPDGYHHEKFVYGANNPKVKMIQGHFDIRFLDIVERPYKAFTFLRHPVERAVSQYYFFRENGSSPLLDASLSISEVYRSPYAPRFENLQVRTLCGKPTGDLTTDDLRTAIEAAETRFAFVGRVDRIDRDIKRLAELFGMTKGALERVNVTKSRPLLSDVSRHDLEIIEKNNALDWALYNHMTNKAA